MQREKREVERGRGYDARQRDKVPTYHSLNAQAFWTREGRGQWGVVCFFVQNMIFS